MSLIGWNASRLRFCVFVFGRDVTCFMHVCLHHNLEIRRNNLHHKTNFHWLSLWLGLYFFWFVGFCVFSYLMIANWSLNWMILSQSVIFLLLLVAKNLHEDCFLFIFWGLHRVNPSKPLICWIFHLLWKWFFCNIMFLIQMEETNQYFVFGWII